MTTEHERTPAKASGRKYASVDALMEGEGVSPQVKSKIAELESESRISLHLAKLRHKAGLTQEQIAIYLGTTQSAVSKLESSNDDELTLKEIKAYAKATAERIGICVGKPLTHVEAVNAHALGIKFHLESLAKIANDNDNDKLQKDIEAFFGKACMNILGILAKVTERLPSFGGESDVRVEIVKSGSISCPPQREISNEVTA